MPGKDCDDLLAELGELLHGELTPERKVQLQRHLDDCPPCFERADFQAQVRQLVAKRCCETVPDSFRARVWAVLQVEIRRGNSAGPLPHS